MNYKPEGYNSLTPVLVIDGAAEAIKLYKEAFGAEELSRLNCPDSNKILHACIRIGDTVLFIADEDHKMGHMAARHQQFYLYLENADESLERAIEKGMSQKEPVSERFWGDRMGIVRDPFGVSWSLSTHVREVSESEMIEAAKKLPKAA